MQFHILSFEGPDPYAQAGGIASRVTGLAQAIADAGLETHLWFVGDPELPGHETHDILQLHRWCQWISRYHPAGVYDGEEGKRTDYAASLPPYLCQVMLLPHLLGGGQAGVRQQVTMFWNANNTFSFERIDWGRLAQAAVITTVSRYMKHLMWDLGINPLVIPNGLAAEAFVPPILLSTHAPAWDFRSVPGEAFWGPSDFCETLSGARAGPTRGKSWPTPLDPSHKRWFIVAREWRSSCLCTWSQCHSRYNTAKLLDPLSPRHAHRVKPPTPQRVSCRPPAPDKSRTTPPWGSPRY